MQVICIGGGAASFFFAAELAHRRPGMRIVILEQGRNVLGKVKISGGGRCNVTHHCFDAGELIKHYPRGGNDLLESFRAFGPGETADWFARRAVELKTEADGRMFPVSDDSQTIIDCLLEACRQGNVEVRTQSKVTRVRARQNGQTGYNLHLLNGEQLKADLLFVAPGGSKQFWQQLEHLGMEIVPPVPSLFTFQIRDARIQGLAGISVPQVRLQTIDHHLISEGPLLITHRGLSGPAVLVMSAWGARTFNACDYRFTVEVDFRPDLDVATIKSWRDGEGKRLLGNHQMAGLPKRLFSRLLEHAGLDGSKKYATLSNQEMDILAEVLKASQFEVIGQNRFKEEFVTAGGVHLDEVDLRTFASKRFPNMYLAGEVLNIDAVTGGFNFQAAWTGAWLAARAVAG